MGGVGDIVRKAPNALIYTVGACFVAVVFGLCFLIADGKDPAALWSFINRTTNVISALFSGGAVVTAGAAYVSSSKAEKQTNGDLEQRMMKVVNNALDAREDKNGNGSSAG